MATSPAPMAANLAIWRTGTPQISSSADRVIAITSAEPMSGWSMIRSIAQAAGADHRAEDARAGRA